MPMDRFNASHDMTHPVMSDSTSGKMFDLCWTLLQEEEGDNKLPCGCGAPNCRGTLN